LNILLEYFNTRRIVLLELVGEFLHVVSDVGHVSLLVKRSKGQTSSTNNVDFSYTVSIIRFTRGFFRIRVSRGGISTNVNFSFGSGDDL
jgi:hypothetical protein